MTQLPTTDLPSSPSWPTPGLTVQSPVLSQTIDDLAVPGVVVEVDPDTADLMGAFEETALSAEDAFASQLDMVAADGE